MRPAPTILRDRYRRISRFILKSALAIVWSDIVLNRPGLRVLRTPLLPRLQRMAREYCALAVEMGGVLIKLGQFSTLR